MGRVHQPVFRLVLTDSKNSTKSGRFQEILGSFDARASEKAEFKNDRITYWIGQGAQVSDTVHNLLVTQKVITGKKINALPKKKPIAKEDVEATAQATPVEAAPVQEAPEPVVETPAEPVEATA